MGLEENLTKKREGSGLFSKLYSLKDLRYCAQYALGFSTAAGIGNTVCASSDYFNNFCGAFSRQVGPSFLVNLFYARAVTSLSNTERGRLYANLFCTVINIGFYLWHKLTGTESPFDTTVANSILGYTLTNIHVSQVKRKGH